MKPPAPPGADSKALRVLVVEDSPFAQDVIVKLCEEDGDIAVVGVAGTGRDAVEATRTLRPDVITLDLGLPDCNGFEVTTRIMEEQPTPILVLTATLRPHGRLDAFHALTLGALDVLEKPGASEIADARWRKSFRDRLCQLAKVPVIPHVARRIERLGNTAKRLRARVAQPSRGVRPDVIVIVGSAGGARAVRALLRSLDPVPIPVLVALHMGRELVGSFARYLSEVSNMPVRTAVPGELLARTTIHALPGGSHLELVAPNRFRCVEVVEGARYVPSFDHLLRSVAVVGGAAAAGVVLSGIGADGAEGLLSLRQRGGLTLAQDEATSIVFGMPRAAAELGAVMHQKPPDEIGAMIGRWAAGHPQGGGR